MEKGINNIFDKNGEFLTLEQINVHRDFQPTIFRIFTNTFTFFIYLVNGGKNLTLCSPSSHIYGLMQVDIMISYLNFSQKDGSN